MLEPTILKSVVQLKSIAERNRDHSLEGRVNEFTMSAQNVYENLAAIINEVYKQGPNAYPVYLEEKFEKLNAAIEDVNKILPLCREWVEKHANGNW